MELPAQFLERLARILPDEAHGLALAGFAATAPTVFRANLLRATPEALEAELREGGFELEPLAWPPASFRVPDEQRRALTESTAAEEGRLWIQNPSSMIPPLVLDAKPGEEVLDLAAAPGSKTLQLAATGARVTAVEKVRGRFYRLKANLAAQGAGEVETRLADGTRYWRRSEEFFDAVLVDTPCSSEGRFRVDDPESFQYWSPRKIKEMSRVQKRLLFSAVRALRPGGRLVYSTCTFAPEENEAVVAKILRRFAGILEVEEVDLPIRNLQSGMAEWGGRSYPEELSAARRVLPDGLFEAFFICRLRKTAPCEE